LAVVLAVAVGVGGCTVHRDYQCREARARAAAMAASNAGRVVSLQVIGEVGRWCYILV
jgi:hypothetical protein